MTVHFIFTVDSLKRGGVKKYITAILMLVSFFLYGQQDQSIYGVVFSKKDKKPLAGASIEIVKSNTQKKNLSEAKQTLTNEQGLFNLTLPLEVSQIIISLPGYKSLTLPLKKNKQYYAVYLDETVMLNSNIISLNKVVIGKKLNTLNIISDIDIQTNPVNSSQDILRKVPGLFIGQHAGGGKAEQIFLRGFDIDHGTDLAISVDDMPVNLVSHAHGQGYADLHFVIPETIDKIDFGKGAYYANKGDFDNAGYVNFKTKTTLDNSQIKMEVGQFDTYRLSGLFNVLKGHKHNAYVATEFINTDGAFDSPQNFNRMNIFGKYTGNVTNSDKLGITASHFTSKWDASGQIPQRAIDRKIIDRFGAIDDTEGGNTSRTNLIVKYDKLIDENTSIKNQLFLSKYDFELYSNFTFFLNDPINGDQIRQKENRTIYGLNSEYKKSFSIENTKATLNAGINLRYDQSRNNELSHTVNRKETLKILKLGDINETNFGGYVNTTFDFGKWTINPAVRVDYFSFEYNDKLQPHYETQVETKAIASPKLNIFYNYSQNLQFYLKTGKGFHSNDTRVVIAKNDKKILPASYGFDAGFAWKPFEKWFLNTAYWYLYLQQEFVYVGDEAVVEPSGKTRRQGVELSLRYQPFKWLFWNLDTTYTHARSIDEPKGQNYIPLAPDFTLVSGLNFKDLSGFYGGINLRHIKNRPANEDNSITAKGYTVVDFNINYQWHRLDFGIQIQNLFDTKWNETQFATESRLKNEAQPVEEIHFTPGTPFFLKGVIKYSF